jgi:group I intron endonuclease
MARKVIRGIYCIENLINNKKYIGQSKDIYTRWSNHKWYLNENNHENNHLQNAWNKYGENNFKFYIIEECNENIIDEREQYLIAYYKTTIDLNGYNLDTGGNHNKHHSKETKEKIRKSNTGKVASKETRLKISKNRTGKLIGEKHFMYGKHLSIETKYKLSQALTGKFAYDKHYEATSVICLNTNKIFTTIKEAGEYYNTSQFNISKCCNGERISSGKLDDGTPLQWEYYKEGKDYTFKEYKPKRNNKEIVQYDLNGNFIGKYESAREAEKLTGISYKNISRYCNGTRNHKQYIFKFVA